MCTRDKIKESILDHYERAVDEAEREFLSSVGKLAASEARVRQIHAWHAAGRPGWAELRDFTREQAGLLRERNEAELALAVCDRELELARAIVEGKP